MRMCIRSISTSSVRMEEQLELPTVVPPDRLDHPARAEKVRLRETVAWCLFAGPGADPSFRRAYVFLQQAPASRNWRLKRKTYARRKEGSAPRSEEHTSELQSQSNLVCRL